VCRIIQQALETGEAPKEWNACHIVLLPKSDQANTTKDFRPISVGNTLYRLLTKIITDRLLPYMSKIISNTETTFIKGRSIADNVIHMKEIIHSFYERQYKDKAFALKVDIMKFFLYPRVGFHSGSTRGPKCTNKTDQANRVVY
jgi:Reverse transcriptase (RNA-dependent DNA polymerase)